MTKILLLLSAMFCFQSLAQVNGKIDLSLRTKPLQYNGVGTVAYDGVLWGDVDKANPKYGFYRVGAKLGGSPTAAAFVQVAPIAPVVFEVQKGTTYRFIKTSATDCDTYECLHKVDRTDYSIRLGGAVKKFVLLMKFMLREIDAEEGNRPVYLELESFHVTPGYHHYFESTITLGYKLDDTTTTGIIYNGGELSGGSQHFYSGYGFYSRKCGDYGVTGALGYYDNAYDKFRGVSGLIIVSRAFGDTLALF